MSGWIGGTSLADGVWEIVKQHVSKSKRQGVAEELFELFENHNCEVEDSLLHEVAFPNDEIDEDGSDNYLETYDIDGESEFLDNDEDED